MADYNLTVQRRVTQQAVITIYGVENERVAQESFEKTYKLFPDMPQFENYDTNGWPEVVHIEEVK
jgi:hypothetical protein